MISDELVGEVQLASNVLWFHLILEIHLRHLEHLSYMLGISSILQKIEWLLNVWIVCNLSLE